MLPLTLTVMKRVPLGCSQEAMTSMGSEPAVTVSEADRWAGPVMGVMASRR